MGLFIQIIKYLVLNPKNYKDFYSDVSTDAEVHKDLVAEFVSFFYGKVRGSLSSLENPRINIPGLGTFKIRTLEKMTYTGYEKHVPVKNKLKEMENALIKIEENIKNKKNFKDEIK